MVGHVVLLEGLLTSRRAYLEASTQPAIMSGTPPSAFLLFARLTFQAGICADIAFSSSTEIYRLLEFHGGDASRHEILVRCAC
jgi:hypothetical protein